MGSPAGRLVLQPLTAEAFAPFGEVVQVRARDTARQINAGLTARYHDLARVDAGRGVCGISIFRSRPVTLPFTIRQMERHPHGSQAFINTARTPFAIVVAPPGPFRSDAMRAFLATPEQSVNYRPGTWHHYLLTLESEGDFVIVDRVDPEDNCDEVQLEEPRVLVAHD